ncbi:flavodoxin family protein [Anaeramoeba flamelloides]|uniref:Flavodoxin family protein n=1 Tax=Anaeramoeba flamelloides TaxID=1746091 RepID=A0AAV7Z6S3_9EUKA|nr:flavodoxin family protein [Anaeramoeba flamelloides]
MSECTLYRKLDNKQVRCVCCSIKCVINNGETGECGVRKNRNGKLYLEVYNRPNALHVDPIEKKPLMHFYPASKALSLGTVGCNFRCSFCQNWHLSQASRTEDIENLTLKYNITPKEMVKMAIKNKCKVIAYTYNEPTIFAEYAIDIAKLAHEKNIKNVYVSNGYQSVETIEALAPYLDGINVDLKAFTSRFYHELSGVRLSPVLSNIKRWHDLGVWIEVTTLIIPGENDSDEELTNIAKFLYNINPDIPWHISAYRDAYKMKGKGRTQTSTLLRAYKIGKKIGLHHIYTGNVRNSETKATYCPNCKKKLIERNYYDTKVIGLKNGCCKKCNTPIIGIWSDKSQNRLVKKKITNPQEIHSILYPKELKEDNEYTYTNYFKGSTVEKEKQILILYGTQTGTTEQVANQLYQLLIHSERTKNSFDFRIIDLEDYNPRNLPKERNIILLSSTHGEGEPPDNCVRLFNYLEKIDISTNANLLEKLKFAIFGLGNSTYCDRYQKISKYFDNKFELLGGQRLIKRGEGDEFQNNIEKSFKKWFNLLVSSLCDTIGIKEQKIKIHESKLKVIYLGSKENINEKEKEKKKKKKKKKEKEIEKEKEKEIEKGMDIENLSINNNNKIYNSINPFQSKLLIKKELIKSSNERSCLHLEFDITGSNFHYNCGDHVVILPKNPIEIVDKIANRLDLNVERVFKVVPSSRFKKIKTIGECLECDCDLTGAVKISILKRLLKYAHKNNEKNEIKKLIQNTEFYNEWMINNKRGFVDVLGYFQSIELSFEQFLEIVPRLAPRYYSISSSPKNDQNKINITVRVVEHGLCTNYLKNLKTNDFVNLYIQKSSFKIDHNNPSILIATGTGLAPFRGMIQERLYLKTNENQKKFPKSLLFFGCRNKEIDFIYKDEIEKAVNLDVISNSFFAFSRDQQEKIYVQQKVLEQGKLIKKLLKNNNTKILVCGIANMAIQVKNIFIKIIGEKKFLKLQKNGLYLEETW